MELSAAAARGLIEFFRSAASGFICAAAPRLSRDSGLLGCLRTCTRAAPFGGKSPGPGAKTIRTRLRLAPDQRLSLGREKGCSENWRNGWGLPCFMCFGGVEVDI